MAFTLPPLPYAPDALEPHIDKMTMEIHHGKHHNAYVTNLNKALESAPDLAEQDRSKNCWRTTAPSCRRTSARPCATMAAATSTTPCSGRSWGRTAAARPSGNVAQAINGAFGSFDTFKEKFNAAGAGRFGSGWAWLVKSGGKLGDHLHRQPGQPGDGRQARRSWACDVWEHAYYLKYQNRRPDYLAAWWNVVNWEEIEKRFNAK